jgi:hypothetical protein
MTISKIQRKSPPKQGHRSVARRRSCPSRRTECGSDNFRSWLRVQVGRFFNAQVKGQFDCRVTPPTILIHACRSRGGSAISHTALVHDVQQKATCNFGILHVSYEFRIRYLFAIGACLSAIKGGSKPPRPQLPTGPKDGDRCPLSITRRAILVLPFSAAPPVSIASHIRGRPWNEAAVRQPVLSPTSVITHRHKAVVAINMLRQIESVLSHIS